MTRGRTAGVILLFLAALGAPEFLHPAEALQEITVREGDTLWSISQYFLKDPKRWPDLLRYNPQLTRDPMVALPGIKLRVPVALIKESLRTAEIIYIHKDVRYRRSASSEWQPARLNTKLVKDDGVRTLPESAARIQFPTGEVVKMSENSLVIVRPEKGQDALELLSGNVSASQSRVITAGGAVVEPKGPAVNYSARIKADRSELVLVFKGEVDVTAHGKTVRVAEGFGSEIKPLMPPAEPIPLPQIPGVPSFQGGSTRLNEVAVKAVKEMEGLFLSVDLPSLSAPTPAAAAPNAAPGTVAASASGEGRARSVSRPAVLKGYHLQVDDRDDFENPLHDKVYPLSEKLNLRALGLTDGRFYWRIAFVDALGLESPFSVPQPFEIDLTPPSLTLIQPAEEEEFPSHAEFTDVTGHTESGVVVQVEDKSVSVDADGRFKTSVYLHEGKNRMAVVARDESGNETSVERVVYRLTAGGGKAKPAARPAVDEEKQRRGSFLATFGIGLLTIGSIIGIIAIIAL
jgi:hypothetical protein